MIINVGLALLGEDLELQKRVSIEVEGGIIKSITNGFRGGGLTFKNGVALPALVNAHIHILDYAFQEVGLNLKLSRLVSEPHGLKHRLIAKLTPRTISHVALDLFRKLVRQGVYAAIVFCERFEAVNYLKQASQRAGLNAIVLTRPKRVDSTLLIDEALRNSDGLGLDSPLRYDVAELMEMRRKYAEKGLLKAVHVSETPETHEKGDFRLSLDFLDSDLIVHGVYLEEEEVRELSLRGVSLAICPRSNMWFSSGLPPLSELFKHNVNVVLGTDNAGWISPDIWRELETLFNISRLQGLCLNPRGLLKTATVNVNNVRNLKTPSNILGEGFPANFIVLDGDELGLKFSRNIYASIVKRGCAEAVVFKVFSS